MKEPDHDPILFPNSITCVDILPSVPVTPISHLGFMIPQSNWEKSLPRRGNHEKLIYKRQYPCNDSETP